MSRMPSVDENQGVVQYGVPITSMALAPMPSSDVRLA